MVKLINSDINLLLKGFEYIAPFTTKSTRQWTTKKPRSYFAVRSVRARGVDRPRRTQRDTQREREEKRGWCGRLTVARPRGPGGEQVGAEEVGGRRARHQPRAVLGQQQDGTVRRGVAGQRRRPRRRPPRRLEQGPHCRRTRAPRRRCPPAHTNS